MYIDRVSHPHLVLRGKFGTYQKVYLWDSSNGRTNTSSMEIVKVLFICVVVPFYFSSNHKYQDVMHLENNKILPDYS